MQARTWRVLLTSFAGLFLLSTVWAISTPLGGSPDEPSHIIKAAAVVHGQPIGEPTEKPSWTSVQVPRSVAGAQSWPGCYAFQATAPASCSVTAGSGLGLTEATTSAGLYNPTYYALVGWPSLVLAESKQVVFGMRLVSAALSSALLAIAFTALLSLRRPWLTTVGFLTAATPMLFFLNGSVNPNSLEIAGSMAVLALLLRVTIGSSPDRGFGWSMAGVAVAGALTVNARSISPLWLLLFILVVLVVTPPQRLRAVFTRASTWIAIGVVALATGGAAAWVLATNTLGQLGTFAGAGTVGPVRAFVTMLLDRSFDAGIVGVFGWLDTWNPAFVYVLWSALAVVLAVAAAVLLRGRLLVGFLLMLAIVFLGPPAIQAASVVNSGYIWQGRYTLVAFSALFVYAVIALSVSPDRGEIRIAERVQHRVYWIVGTLVVLAHVGAVATSIRRYATGATVDWIDMLRGALWLPPLGFWPWLVLAAAASASLVWLGASARAERPATGLETPVTASHEPASQTP
ncbi:Predicted membrane protein [Plantibacter sp. VKM Ac-1784]|uniref:Predicted membrane protein n=2 Tax=Plantibacter elymi (nom. nud.) TaxID=199708 RepID=A0ABY1RD56_9MICO|nr:Predicted membrane protein [Plantibacter sp. VKM Ac-1784]